MTDQREVVPRPAARVLLCDADGRLLMFRAQFDGRQFWITPGGGLHQGESFEDAAVRELWEETGLQYPGNALHCAWVRSHTYEFRGQLIDQQERYYLLQVEGSTPAIVSDYWEEQERNDLLEHRWWSCDEIEASDEVFAPRRLGSLLRQLLRDGCPAEPFDAGV